MAIASKKNFNIKNLTSFKIGGYIEEVFSPANIDEYKFIAEQNPNTPILGNLSNTLVSSMGYDGKIILTSEMNGILIEGTKIVADCGVKGPKLSQEACKAGLSGFEFMIGFPGSIGGEVYMNASAHNQCISDYLTEVICFSKNKGIVKYSKEEMDFGYRSSRCQNEDLVVLQVKFDLKQKNPDEIQKQMNENLDFRRKHQPSLALPNC